MQRAGVPVGDGGGGHHHADAHHAVVEDQGEKALIAHSRCKLMLSEIKTCYFSLGSSEAIYR